MEVNSMYFSKEQVEAGEMKEFLDVLLKQCYGASKYYNDIHIKPEDCGAFIVEWINVPWDHSYGGSFQYVEEDQYIMTEYSFPDRHYEILSDDEEYKERLDEWLKENPGWVKTEYGTWTNDIENEAMRKYFEDTAKTYVEEDIAEAENKDIHYENGVPQGE